MKKKTATRTAHFITELMQVGVMKLADDIFEGQYNDLCFTPLTAEDVQKILYVGDKVFHHGYGHTSYDVMVVADTIILLVSDVKEQIFNSVEIKDSTID